MTDPQDLYRSLYTIRRFEETVLENFSRGVFYGTTHTYLGQEANAVGVLAERRAGDIVFSNHRSHGHFLAYGGDPRALFAELMGRATGVCGGRGGSQHLQWRNFYSNGVLGSTIPVATGTALAEKFQATSNLTIAFTGDGALGEGVVYESLNMAALWEVPILFVVENNHIAQTTPLDRHLAGEIPARFSAFGIPTRVLDTSDVTEILDCAGGLLEEIRSEGEARALILQTERFGPHSKGDDTRPPEVIERLRRERDPLAIQATRLPPDLRKQIEDQIDQNLARAYEQALNDPLPDRAFHDDRP